MSECKVTKGEATNGLWNDEMMSDASVSSCDLDASRLRKEGAEVSVRTAEHEIRGARTR